MNTRDEEYCRWLALRRVPGMGWRRLRHSLETYGSSEIMWKKLAQSSADKLTWQRQAEEEFKKLEYLGIRLLLFDDPDYPDNLNSLPDSPLFIYRRGVALVNTGKAVAVVGSRMSSPYGRQVTIEMVKQLVDEGFTIISGMARGIDTVAHQTALDRGGQTIAVCGYGLDQDYPGQSRRLARAIEERGQLMSAFGLGVSAQAYTFAVRNSLIAALSKGVLVTEASENSGSLLTAQWATKYKRPVLTVPGSIFSQGSQGPHRLIKMGADLVVDAADIVDKLGQLPLASTDHLSGNISDTPSHFKLSVEQQKLVKGLQQQPQSIDELSRQTGLMVGQVSAMLTSLELKGIVCQMGQEWVVTKSSPGQR